MGFYDELAKQSEANLLTTQLEDIMELYKEKFGELPMIPIEMSFSPEGLIVALKKAVESNAPGVFKA